MISLRCVVCATTLVLSLTLAACSAEENDPKVGQQTTSESPAAVSEEPSESAEPIESDYISSAKPLADGDLPSVPPQEAVKTDEAPAAPPANSDARAASESCNDTMWTWPWCHISRPSIPRIQSEGPRPPLTPKSNAWCWAKLIDTDQVDALWSLVSNTKVPVRFWPDYYHRTYQLIVWKWNLQGWYYQSEFRTADCDA
jgi:hypothetical protein